MSAIKVNPIITVSVSSTPSEIKPVIPQMKPDTDYEKELCKSVKKKTGMDSFGVLLFNRILNYFLSTNNLRNAMFMICMANWGTRFGDTVRVRFCHLFDEHGQFRDSFMLNGGEEKTGKENIYYNNDAIKKIVTMYLLENPREYYDYLFVSESRNKSRITLREIEINERFGDSLENLEEKLNEVTKSKSNLLQLFTRGIVTENELECELKRLRKNEQRLTEDIADVKSAIKRYKSNAPNIAIQTPMGRAAAEVFIKSALRDLNIITENRLDKSDAVNVQKKFNTHSLRKLFSEELYRTGCRLQAYGKIKVDLGMLKIVQDKLMHSNSSITDRYNHIEENAFKDICMNLNLGLNVIDMYYRQ